MARRGNRALAALAACAALWWCGSLVSNAFLAGASLRGNAREVASARGGSVARRAFAFDLATSEDHEGLVTQDADKGIRISTHGGLMEGSWNTVLGDTELPSTGRSYFEVKIVKKPTDAWEYIGVAEASTDVTVPLTRNKKGAGWFYGATWSSSCVYTYMPMEKEFNEAYKKQSQTVIKTILDSGVGFPEKDTVAQVTEARDKVWTGAPGTHVGVNPGVLPPFRNGMVIGVDVDMDKGTLAFWADGKYLGIQRDMKGAINLKGKKLVPAVSVYGRTTGAVNQFTVMEVRSGLEPPPLPTA